MRKYASLAVLITCVSSIYGQTQETPVADPAADGALTLESAISTALLRNPDLETLRREIAIAEGRAVQAGLWPNPVIEAGIEGFTPGGDGPSGDTAKLENLVAITDTVLGQPGLWLPSRSESDSPDQQQRIVAVSQTLPLSRAPAKARAAGRLEVDRLRAEYDALTLNTRAEVRAAFCQVLKQQQAVLVYQQLAGTLEQTLDLARSQQNAGEIAEMEVIKAEANFERFTIDLDTALKDLEAARVRLALLLGQPDRIPLACEGELDETLQPIDWTLIEQAIESHPREEAWRLRVEKAEADLRTARAERIPDLDLSIGYRRYDYTDQDTWDFKAGIEIPLFNRNQGTIRAARENIAREEAAIASEKNGTLAELQTIRSAFETHSKRAGVFKDRVLPKMKESLDITQTAFGAGDTGMIEVLDAHRSLSEARLAYLDELAAIQIAVAGVERLAGKVAAAN